MTATVICHGMDELMLETGFTSDERSAISDVRNRTVLALGASGSRVLRSDSTFGLQGWTCRIPSVDLRFHPQGNRRFIVHAWIEPEALHSDPAGVYRIAWSALDAIRRIFVATGAEPEIIALHSLALHADVIGWKYSPSTEGRVLFRPRRHLDGHLTGGQWTGSVFGKRLDIYDKQAELQQEPRKAWIRGFWPEEVPHVVWRVEHRWDRRALAGRPAPLVFDELWRERLDEVRLVRRPKGKKGDPNRRWPTDPVWRLLGGLHFTEPWMDGPSAPRSIVVGVARRRALHLARMLRSLASVVALEGRARSEWPRRAQEVVATALVTRPALEADMGGWAAQAALRAGLVASGGLDDEYPGAEDGPLEYAPDEGDPAA